VCVGILGNKIGMTQIFDTSGKVIPVTIIHVGPCFITQVKTVKTDGYDSIQIGYSYLKANARKSTKPLLGHFEKAGTPPLRYLREYSVLNPTNYKLGENLKADIFLKGKTVDVTGYTIGKGFTGNTKRNKFSRGPMTHGSKNHRAPGSIGAGTDPGRVFPGKRMAGQLGNTQQTIKNLEIIDINSEENLLVIKGSVPGKTGNLLSIKYSKT
jgi:large subunit ribosomal protein L3